MINESIVRSVYIRECSKLLDVDEKILYSETARLRRNRFAQKIKQINVKELPSNTDSDLTSLRFESVPDKYTAEKEIIRLLVLYPDHLIALTSEDLTQTEKYIADYIIQEIEQDELEFHQPLYSQIFSEITTRRKINETTTEKYFINHPDENLAKTVINLITSAYDLSKIWKRFESFFETEEMRLKEIVLEAILAFKNERVMKLLKDAETDLRHAQEQNNQERIQTLQLKFKVLGDLRLSISKGLSIIVAPT